MIGHQVEVLFLEMDWCQPLHQEHCGAESLASEENIPNFCTGGRDARQQKNQTEISETSALGA
jgi:hypothetical protein